MASPPQVERKRTRKRGGWDEVDSAAKKATTETRTDCDPASSLSVPLSTQQLLEKARQKTAKQQLLVPPTTSQGHNSNARIYVGSLHYDLTENDVIPPFSAFGQIVKIDMPKEAPGRSKGFCFLEYASSEAADAALKGMEGQCIGGRPIKLGRPVNARGANLAATAPLLANIALSAGTTIPVLMMSPSPVSSAAGTSGTTSAQPLPPLPLPLATPPMPQLPSLPLAQPPLQQTAQSQQLQQQLQQQQQYQQSSTNMTLQLLAQLLQSQQQQQAMLLQPQQQTAQLLQSILTSQAHSPSFANPNIPAALLASFPQLSAAPLQQPLQQGSQSQQQPQQQQQQSNKNCKIYVGSVSFDLTADLIKQLFEVCGPIVSCSLVADGDPGRHKGYGFIEYKEEKSAQDAIEQMDGYEIAGRKLKVGWAHTAAVTAGPQQGNPAPAPKPEHDLISREENLSISGSARRVDLMRKLGARDNVPSALLLKNMVLPSAVDKSLRAEVEEECRQFGSVLDVHIEVESDSPLIENAVRIYVKFGETDAARRAKNALDKRWFGGRLVRAEEFDTRRFEQQMWETS